MNRPYNNLFLFVYFVARILRPTCPSCFEGEPQSGERDKEGLQTSGRLQSSGSIGAFPGEIDVVAAPHPLSLSPVCPSRKNRSGMQKSQEGCLKLELILKKIDYRIKKEPGVHLSNTPLGATKRATCGRPYKQVFGFLCDLAIFAPPRCTFERGRGSARECSYRPAASRAFFAKCPGCFSRVNQYLYRPASLRSSVALSVRSQVKSTSSRHLTLCPSPQSGEGCL